MTWLKLDDGFIDHPKVAALSDRAFRLHVAGMCFAARTLSDGFVPKGWTHRLLPKVPKAAVQELVDASLWEEAVGGHMIHDFLLYNPTKEKVVSERDHAARRKALHADPGLVAAIRKRDDNRCRYCGQRVNWSDRRGPLGATYDHIVPRGPNSLENVVVACRGCNSAKGPRALDQSGMRLLPEPKSGPRSKSVLDPAPVPTRPDPTPKGLGSESVFTSVLDDGPAQGGPSTALASEQVALNVESARALRHGLRAVPEQQEAG